MQVSPHIPTFRESGAGMHGASCRALCYKTTQVRKHNQARVMQKVDDMPEGGVVIAPGNYDGVHRGHQVLIARAREMADQAHLRVRVLTFDPHPAALFAPDKAPEPLTTPARRRELLLAHGADEVDIDVFDRAYADQSPEEFVQRQLKRGGRAFVVGHDFRFGRRAAGDVELLRQMGQAQGFDVHVQPQVTDSDHRISSSAVREALREGRVNDATRLLGHMHDVTGTVEEGDKRGRLLGFPTANLRTEPVLRPADGVYAVLARRLGGAGKLLPGVANLGQRPTFTAGRSLEVHLLGFDGPLYGEPLRVGFVARLRGEQRFDGPESLKAQIKRDCEAAEHALAACDKGRAAWI